MHNSTEAILTTTYFTDLDEITTLAAEVENDFTTLDTNDSFTSEYNATSDSESMLRSCEIYRFSLSVGVTGILCIWGIVGNILSLLVFNKFHEESDTKSRSSAPLLLSALALSDITVLITLFIMKTVPSFCSYTGLFPEYFKIYAFFLVYGWPCVGVAQSVNTWITVLVALHRFVAVVYPHRAVLHCTHAKARRHLVVVIFVVILYEVPTFLDNKVVSVWSGVSNETVYWPAYGKLSLDKNYQLIYKTSLYYITMYLIPWIMLAVITVFLVRAVKQARDFRRNISVTKDNTKDSTDTTEDISTSLIAVVVTSLICRPWEPVRRLIEFILGSKPGCGHYYFYYEEFPSLTSALNSSANFILYMYFGRRYRQKLLELMKCRKYEREQMNTLSTRSSSDMGSSVKSIRSMATRKGSV